MSAKRSVRVQLAVVSAVLLAVMGFLMADKLADGMPLIPGQRDSVWQIEARVSFEADQEHDGVRVSLAVPDVSLGYRILDEHAAASGYGASTLHENQARRMVWTRREATGKQLLFYRTEIFDVDAALDRFVDEPPEITPPVWVEPQATAVQSLIATAQSRSSTNTSFVRELIKASKASNTRVTWPC